jgi:hypothetical protein
MGVRCRTSRLCLSGSKTSRRGQQEKIHQHLKPDALEKVEQQLIAVTNIASCSIDQKDFEARCMAAFPVKGQMKLLCGGVTMNNRIVECASRAGRLLGFMTGEKNMMEALRSAEEFTEQLRIHGCVNHHFVNFMMMKAIMKVFDDLRRDWGRATTQT